MKDQYKTKRQLIEELETLLKQVVKLKKAETKRKRAEEALRESEERFRLLFENSEDAILLTAPDGSIFSANPAACGMFGYTEEELHQIGRDGVVDKSDPRLPIAVEERKRTGRFRGGLDLIRKDGTKFPTEISSSVFKDKDGNLRTSMIIRDMTERKQMEEALRRKSEEQELLLDNIDARIWYLTNVETYGAVNKGYANFYGKEKKDLEGKKQWDVLKKGEAEVCIAGNREVFEKKRKQYSEEWLTNSKGERRLHSIIKTPKIDEQGNVKYVFCVATDITEKKRVEEELRRREKEIALIAENVPALLSFVDQGGYYRYVNRRYEEWFGIPQGEIIGKHYKETVGGATHELMKGYIEKALAGLQVRFEEPLPYATGGSRWVSAHYIPNVDSTGKVDGFFALVTDITERKRAEEALRESEMRFREMFENMGSGVAIYAAINDGEDFVFTDINPAGARIGQRSREETLGRSVQEVYPGVRDLGLFDVFKRVWKTGKPERYPVARYQDDRLTIWVENYVCRLPSGEIVAIYEDITERKQADTERERLFDQVRAGRERLRSLAQRLLEIQEVERRDLVRRLHDEVGQNLTGLSINLNILRSQMPDEAATKMITRIDDSLRLVEETVERIRDVMAELRPPVLDDYGVAAALNWYGKQFSERTGVATVLHLNELGTRLPSQAETALFRIAQEAMTNVAKYAHAKSVTLTFEEIEESVRLTIADDGIGFDPHTHHQPGAKPEWGLMNMRERAQAIGGSLAVETAPGEGTRIVVEVPKKH
jgi:PAS domain S-box-containing protein